MPSQFSSSPERMASPIWYPQRYNLNVIEEHCTHDRFHMHQDPLAYMTVFRQANLEPGPSGPALTALPTGLMYPEEIKEVKVCSSRSSESPSSA